MSKDIRPLRNCAPREGVFIPRRQVRQMRRARDLLDEARRRASDTVAQAVAEAAQVRRQAHAAGYEDGLLAAASHLLDHLGAVQRLTQQLQQGLERQARDLLGAALERPDALLLLLERWLDAHAGPSDQTVRIWLPVAARGLRLRFERQLEQSGMAAASIAYHDDPRLIVLCGEQVFEFDPPALVAQAQRRLLACNPDPALACAALSAAAAQRWRAAFEQRFMPTAGQRAAAGDDWAEAAAKDGPIHSLPEELK